MVLSGYIRRASCSSRSGLPPTDPWSPLALCSTGTKRMAAAGRRAYLKRLRGARRRVAVVGLIGLGNGLPGSTSASIDALVWKTDAGTRTFQELPSTPSCTDVGRTP